MLACLNQPRRTELALSDSDLAEQFDKHINSPRQSWLLGAGVSFNANIPLMYPLTERTLTLAEEIFSEDEYALKTLDFISSDCGDGAHIEHMLTHLGDLISIAGRSSSNAAQIRGQSIEKDILEKVHNQLLKVISDIVRWGYVAPKMDGESVVEAAQKGKPGKSIVDLTAHAKFVSAVFGASRAGLEFVRTPVEFFTTNYDTLLEDALAFHGIPYHDGFVGGAVGFWAPQSYDPKSDIRAAVTKLHGSIDWYRADQKTRQMLRVRFGDTYPGEDGYVMIYPQSTKYMNTQKDPFAQLFQRFRNRLASGPDHVLMVCGYSFGDDHINDEIEIAMGSDKSQLTLIAFSEERDDQLPKVLQRWRSESWGERVFVATQRGIYHGQSGPVFEGLKEGGFNWWTFEGVSDLLADGLPTEIQEAME